jgi:hypothetical protein
MIVRKESIIDIISVHFDTVLHRPTTYNATPRVVLEGKPVAKDLLGILFHGKFCLYPLRPPNRPFTFIFFDATPIAGEHTVIINHNHFYLLHKCHTTGAYSSNPSSDEHHVSVPASPSDTGSSEHSLCMASISSPARVDMDDQLLTVACSSWPQSKRQAR